MNEPIITDQSITQLLVKWGSGDKAALDELIPLVYDELRKLASGMTIIEECSAVN